MSYFYSCMLLTYLLILGCLAASNCQPGCKVQYNNEIGLIEALLSHHENTGEPKTREASGARAHTSK